LFNQTGWLTREQIDKAFGERLKSFAGYRQRFDPNDRLLNEYFRGLLDESSGAQPVQSSANPSGIP
jgi:hypothetical protein